MLRSLFAVLAVSLSHSVLLAATDSDFNAGVVAFERQDYAGALKAWKPLANQGNSSAQFNVGLLYYMGLGTTQAKGEALNWFRKAADQGVPRAQAFVADVYVNSGDYAQALGWYRKAAENGDDLAQFMLGFMYTCGPYTPWNKVAPTDLTQGVEWFRRAVQADNADAEEQLGSLYEEGRGVIQDYKEAVRLYRMAADQGQSDGQYKLGMMYLLGKGIAKNPIVAHMWFNLAAGESGHIADHARAFPVKSAVEGRELAEEMMTIVNKPEDVELAQELARNWKPRTRVNPAPGSILKK